MADRIVVMNHGTIEQIGVPSEIYQRPASPFVADFVGKTNLLPAKAAGAGTVLVGDQRFACEMEPAFEKSPALSVFFRPEDVQVRGVGAATPNSAAAVVERVEFLGSYSRITLRLNGITQLLSADLSVNDLEEFRVKPGDTLRVAVPADRMRVFETRA